MSGFIGQASDDDNLKGPDVAHETEQGARTFFYFGDGTGGTVALPDGVTAETIGGDPAVAGAYIQGGRAYFFGMLALDLDDPAGADIAAATDPLISPLPAALVPSSVEDPAGGNNIQVTQIWQGDGWQVSTYFYVDGLYVTTPGVALSQTSTPFPTTGKVQVMLGPIGWDVAGAP